MRPKLEGMTRRIVPVAIALLLLFSAHAVAQTKVLTIYFHGTGGGLAIKDDPDDGFENTHWPNDGFGNGNRPGATADLYEKDKSHAFRKTSELLSCGDPNSWSRKVTSVATDSGHTSYKYSVDGLGTPSCLLEQGNPDWGPRGWQGATAEGVMAVQEAMAKNPGATWILNLVGHSRGGVVAMRVAREASRQIDISAWIETINILAYDPVPGIADPIGNLGPSFVLSPLVGQYVGVYAQHHREYAFEPIIPEIADKESTKTLMLRVPGGHSDMVAVSDINYTVVSTVGHAIGEHLLTSRKWGMVSMEVSLEADEEAEFDSLVTYMWTGDYSAALYRTALLIPLYSWRLLEWPCHDEMIRAYSGGSPPIPPYEARFAFVAPFRHVPHSAPWFCAFFWINEERVFWLTDYTVKLTGLAQLRPFRDDSVPDTEAPTRDPLQTLESDCPLTVPVPTANDNSGPILGTTTDELTISTGGIHVIRWTFEDPSHNVLRLEQRVMVTPDDDPPALTPPPDILRALPANSGTPFVSLSADDLGAATTGDVCDVSVAVAGVPPGNNFPLGTTTLTYTATDAWGNAASAEQHVTITVDPPEAVDVSTAPDATSCGTVVGEALLTIPPIPGVTIQRSVPANYAFPVGTTTVTYTLTDQARNTTTVEQTVTVRDETPPKIVPPAALEIAAGGESCTAPWTVEATDHCGPVTVVTNPPSPYPLGTTTVNVTATDDAGNVTTQSFPVTVVDVTAPSLTVPSSLVVEATASDCTPVVTWDPPTASDCGIVTVVSTPPSGSEFGLGTTSVNVTATDASGNETSRSFKVTVLDNTPPLLAALPDISLPAEAGHCEAAVTWTVIATDSCGAVDIVSSRAPGRFPVGTTDVDVTATDGSGNSTSRTFHVTIVDAEAPSISGASANPPVLGAPNHKLVDVAIAYAAGDNCVTATCSLSVSSNEPETGTGDEDFAPDWEVVGPNLVRLRAERAGWGSGRIYTITISCTDAAGNVATRAVTVQVPKSKK